jgi:dUTP pyrophosphatase
MILEVKLKDSDKQINDVLRRSYPTDAGIDVVIQHDTVLIPGENKVDLGFAMELPQGVLGFIFPRSSWMSKGISMNLAPVDPFYSGDYNMCVYNMTDHNITINEGERLCQIVMMPFIPVELVDSFPKTRGSNGLGSTGK